MDKDEGQKHLAAWQAVADLLGYEVVGWTFDVGAGLRRPDWTILNLTKEDRDTLLTIKAALKGAWQKEHGDA